jgi:cystathionine gamma-synthase
MTDPQSLSPRTQIAQLCHYIDDISGAITPPINSSTTFARNAEHDLIGEHIYSRITSPTCDHVEKIAAMLDGGAEALLFGSGMAAIAAVAETLKSGQHIVAPKIMYYAAQDWFRRISENRGIGLSLFDATDPEALSGAIRPNETALVWIETPLNPTWDVIDIKAAATLAHEAGAVLACDCTVSPPVTTRALDLGADIVFHSATKYLNGHSDLTAGLLVTRENNDLWQEIKYIRSHLGGAASAFDAWLLMRGMRTLFVRFDKASENAMKIAKHFEGHPSIDAVLYPGLANHPGHNIARRQMTDGFGGMLSLLIKGGFDDAQRVATKTKLFIPATSLGGVESLIEHRAAVESPSSQVPKNLLRLSVGIEDVNDLINDLEQALGYG